MPTSRFGAATTRLDFSTVGAVHPFTLALGQSVSEQLLEEHALAVGARVPRGQEVVSLTQRLDAVEVVIRAGTTVSADKSSAQVAAFFAGLWPLRVPMNHPP